MFATYWLATMTATGRNEPFGQIYMKEFDNIAPKVSSGAMTVYIAIALCRNSRTLKTPLVGIPLLCQKTGMSRKTLHRHIAGLIDKGFLTKEPKGQRSIYGFPLLELSQE